MTHLDGKTASFWIDSTPEPTFSPFQDNLLVDVAIVGAGIAGLTAATLLKRAGKTVAVIEARRVATGTSGHTTAKITSLHHLIYTQLIDQFGEQKARIYAESNQAAIEQIATLVKEDNIDCDFSRQNAYTFTQSEDKVEQIKDEVDAALMLGLPASFVTETTLPFSISGAVRFDHQAQFHARKYFLHLAQTIPGDGSYLFEETRVKGVDDGDPCQVKTERGIVRAKDVIVATNLPILDQGLFFAKTYPKRSYLIGAPIDSDKAPQGMFISTGTEHYRSIRTTPYDGQTLLLIGGEGHKVGTVDDTEERMGRLEAYARSIFNVEDIAYRWSTQDYVSLDKLPFIGKLTPLSNHIYTATGFSLWGMTKGTLSGMLLSDMLLGRDNPWMELYDATRSSSFFTGESVKENADVAAHWVGDRFKSDVSSLSKVGNNEGKIVTVGADKVAAYRDEAGELHTCSAVCPHLGCIVHWNQAEKSWDCPCHGSRFTYEGEIIHAPAVKKLEKMNLETRV